MSPDKLLAGGRAFIDRQRARLVRLDLWDLRALR